MERSDDFAPGPPDGRAMVSGSRDQAHELVDRRGRRVVVRGSTVVRITGCRSWTDLELADGSSLQFDVDVGRLGALLGTPSAPLMQGLRSGGRSR